VSARRTRSAPCRARAASGTPSCSARRGLFAATVAVRESTTVTAQVNRCCTHSRAGRESPAATAAPSGPAATPAAAQRGPQRRARASGGSLCARTGSLRRSRGRSRAGSSRRLSEGLARRRGQPGRRPAPPRGSSRHSAERENLRGPRAAAAIAGRRGGAAVAGAAERVEHDVDRRRGVVHGHAALPRLRQRPQRRARRPRQRHLRRRVARAGRCPDSLRLQLKGQRLRRADAYPYCRGYAPAAATPAPCRPSIVGGEARGSRQRPDQTAAAMCVAASVPTHEKRVEHTWVYIKGRGRGAAPPGGRPSSPRPRPPSPHPAPYQPPLRTPTPPHSSPTTPRPPGACNTRARVNAVRGTHQGWGRAGSKVRRTFSPVPR